MIFIYSAILLFYSVTLLITLFIVVYLFLLKKRKQKIADWNNEADLLVSEALFREDDEMQLPFVFSEEINRKLKSKLFKKTLTNKIVFTTKNISGLSLFHLQQLYIQTSLDEDAIVLLKSNSWHIKAKAIQHLGIMGIRKTLNNIFTFTNDENELVRMEAQISVLKLSGFEGLRFLDHITYQISEWQQIKLLQEIAHLRKEHFIGIEKWLNSTNHSVVLFALKLVSNYHMFELYKQCLPLLKHNNELIRINTVHTLTQIYEIDSCHLLLAKFRNEEFKIQLEIIQALKDIGDESIVDELIGFLDIANVEMKIALARTISNISEEAHQKLIAIVTEYPLNEIMIQITSELKA